MLYIFVTAIIPLFLAFFSSPWSVVKGNMYHRMVESRYLGEITLQEFYPLNSCSTLNFLFSKTKHWVVLSACCRMRWFGQSVLDATGFFLFVKKNWKSDYLSCRCLHLVRRILLQSGVCLGGFWWGEDFYPLPLPSSQLSCHCVSSRCVVHTNSSSSSLLIQCSVYKEFALEEVE